MSWFFDRLFIIFAGLTMLFLVGALIGIIVVAIMTQRDLSNIKDNDVPTVEYRIDDMVIRHDEDTSYVPITTGKTTMIVPTETDEETVLLKLHGRPGISLSNYETVYYKGNDFKVRLKAEDAHEIADLTGIIYVPKKYGAIQ